MSSSFSRRLAAIEMALAPKATPWPCTVFVRFPETIDEAYARHLAAYGPKPKLMQGGLLVVPALPETDEEIREAEARTAIRQAKLMAFVRQPRTPVAIIPTNEGMAQC